MARRWLTFGELFLRSMRAPSPPPALMSFDLDPSRGRTNECWGRFGPKCPWETRPERRQTGRRGRIPVTAAPARKGAPRTVR
eukprot:3077634-Pyramimonas_sp.AAC.1